MEKDKRVLKEAKYCIRCCIPETQEGAKFDEMGICQTCQSSEHKIHIDWIQREKKLRKILEDAKAKAGNNYDCIIPISNKALTDSKRQNKPESRPWKIAFVKTYTWDDAFDYAKESILEYVNKLSGNKNIQIDTIELPSEMNQSQVVYETIYNKTLSYYFKEEYNNAELVSPIMKELIEEGMKTSVEDYHKALETQTELCHTMDNLLSGYDAIISLSTAGEAPLKNVLENRDPALIWTLTHLPVVSVPMFKSPNGLPFGFQLVARKYNDYLLFNLLDFLKNEKLIPEGCESLQGCLVK